MTIRNVTMFSTSIGIDFQNGAALFVENCTIRDATFAIRFLPSAPGSQLVVTDTIIKNNGSAPSTGGGILIQPSGAGSARVTLDRVTVANNTAGITVDGPTTLAVSNSTITGNSLGNVVVKPTNGASVQAVFDRVNVAGSVFGIRADGSGQATGQIGRASCRERVFITV